ncbi:hypothetical protein [Pseudomonas chlororaphis]|uniref:hypothetical protein n=1 Tax=Pseudomonas chlororaphis TaxID=587753 RepID=UPI0039E2A769
MSYEDMKVFLIWGGVFLALAISTAYQHGAWEIVFYCLLVAATGIWMARAAWRKENPKRND